MSDSEQAQVLRQIRLALQNEDYAAAIEGLHRAAVLAHTGGDRAAEGRHLGNLALLYYRMQQPQQALEYFEKALASARAEGDRVTEDGLLGNIGNILRELKRYNEAVDYLNRALLIAQEIGDIRGRGIWLGNLGLVYDDLGEPQKAVEFHQQSVVVAQELQDQRGLALRLGNLGNSYMGMNDPINALKCFHQAVSVYQALGDVQAMGLRLGIIGNIYAELGRVAENPHEARTYLNLALDCYKDTLIIARGLGDETSQAELLQSLGNVHGNLGNYDAAIEHFVASRGLFQKFGAKDRLEQIRQSLALAESYRQQQQTPE